MSRNANSESGQGTARKYTCVREHACYARCFNELTTRKLNRVLPKDVADIIAGFAYVEEDPIDWRALSMNPNINWNWLA